MRFTFLYLIILVSSNCFSQNDVTQFETLLGKEESNALTKLVSIFEKEFLIKKYPKLNIDDAYTELLKELNNEGDVLYWKDISNDGYEMFRSSGLRSAIYEHSEDNINSYGSRIKVFGKYATALNSIKNKSNFLKEYLYSRNASGDINPSIFLIRILNANVNFNDFFLKRLIITELVH